MAMSTNPLLSPVVAADLTGLPPVLVQVGTNEMLLDEALDRAALFLRQRVRG